MAGGRVSALNADILPRHVRPGWRGGRPGLGRCHTPANALGARLRMLRMHGHMRQVDLAVRMQTGAGRISDYELGARIPSLPLLKRYADVFGMTVADLLTGVL